MNMEPAAPFRYPEGDRASGWLRTINGLPVLCVTGAPEQMGAAIGALAVRPAPRMTAYPEDLLRHDCASWLRGPLVWAGERMIRPAGSGPEDRDGRHRQVGGDRPPADGDRQHPVRPEEDPRLLGLPGGRLAQRHRRADARPQPRLSVARLRPGVQPGDGVSPGGKACVCLDWLSGIAGLSFGDERVGPGGGGPGGVPVAPVHAPDRPGRHALRGVFPQTPGGVRHYRPGARVVWKNCGGRRCSILR